MVTNTAERGFIYFTQTRKTNPMTEHNQPLKLIRMNEVEAAKEQGTLSEEIKEQ
jgi:hypothetical protein